MSKKIEVPEGSVGFGYVGVWCDEHRLGWCMPEHVTGNGRGYPEPPGELWKKNTPHPVAGWDNRAYLCRITVEPILDSKGRPITRKPKGK